MQSPVAILQKQRQYRASSYSQGNPLGIATGTTPSSLSSSFIDHAFDHPTPTSFSQLQLLSSSVTSNDGSDYTHRVPKVEEQFCSGFNCCGLELDDLHHLLEHFEECHVLPGGGNTPANPSAAAAIAAATGNGKTGSRLASTSSIGANNNGNEADTEGASDMPDFDDFDDAHNNSLQITNGNINSGLPTSSGVGPTLSAPPSPALSSYSDHHPSNSTNGINDPLYELKTKRRVNSSNSSFPSFTNQGGSIASGSQSRNLTAGGSRTNSRSPPSDYDESSLSIHSDREDDASSLLFTRRNRQQSVDSLASVSTNASTSSKKRNFNTALGTGAPSPSNTGNVSSTISAANIPAGMQGHQPAKPSLTGMDFANIRGVVGMGGSGSRGGLSGFSTPDSSRPGTPASEHEGIEMPGVGCVPPSLLFPLRHSQNPYSSAEEDSMTTDEDDDDGRSAEETDDDDDQLDGMDENIRFQHQLLQQQQMLYNGPQTLNPQMLNGNNSNNQNNVLSMMMNNNVGNNQNLNMQQQQQFINNNNNNNNAGMNPMQMQMQMQMMGATPQQIQQGFNLQNMDQNNQSNFASMLGTTPTAEPSMKKKKTTSSSGGARPKKNSSNKNTVPGGQKYDARIDHAAAAMFSPLTLQGKGGNAGANIPMPTISASTSPDSQASASAATLAAIQAAAAANAFPDASTPTGRVWIPNNAKPFKCPVPGCDKAYKQQNGLKYHRLHGHCNSNSNGTPGEEEVDDGEKEEDKPFGCYVGPACGKKYKNMNGLRYHYQHSGAHGQIGLQMLTNGTHPPPAYPPGHKRAGLKNYGAEFSNNPSPTVVMNQSTAEAILAAISQTTGGQMLQAQPPQQQQQQQQQPQQKQQQQQQQQQQQFHPPPPHGNSRPTTPATSSNLHHQLQHSPLGQHA